MSDLLQIKSPKYLIEINQGEILPIGSFKSPYAFKLLGMSLYFAIKGTVLGTERFCIDIYSTKKADSLLFSSEEFTIPADIKIKPTWLGWIKFSFNYRSVSPNFRYYLFLRQVNYAPAPGSSMALAYDFHDSQYDNSEVRFYNHPLAFRVEGAVDYDI